MPSKQVAKTARRIVLIPILAATLAAAPTTAQQAPAPPAPALQLSACAAVHPPSQSLPGATTLVYRTAGQRPLRLHVFRPDGAARHRPAVLMFFGGGFTGGDAASFARHAKRFAEKGYVAAIADYRVFCRDGTYPESGVEDAAAAYAWLRGRAGEFGIDRRRIVLAGGSAGGLLAASAALRQSRGSRPAALVLFNPVVDLSSARWGLDLPEAIRANTALSPQLLAAISPTAMRLDRLPPTIIFHGTADMVVPIETVDAFCRKAQAAGRTCRLERYPGVGHSFYQRRDVIQSLGVAPFDDTMDKAFAFLDPIVEAR